jgi:hypothetical protein
MRSWVAQSVYFLTTDWTTGVRSPIEAKDFSSALCVQTSSKASLTPIQWLPGSFSGGKSRLELEADHLPHLVPRSRMSRSYNTSPPRRLHGVSGRVLLFYFSQCYAAAAYVNRSQRNKYFTFVSFILSCASASTCIASACFCV